MGCVGCGTKTFGRLCGQCTGEYPSTKEWEDRKRAFQAKRAGRVIAEVSSRVDTDEPLISEEAAEVAQEFASTCVSYHPGNFTRDAVRDMLRRAFRAGIVWQAVHTKER